MGDGTWLQMTMTTPSTEPLEELKDFAAPPALQLQTFSSFEAAQSIESEWDSIVRVAGLSLYATPDWCRVWWRHYARGRSLRLFAIRSGADLVAVLPFFVERLWLPAGPIRVAKMVGSDSTVALVEPAVTSPQMGAGAFMHAMQELLAHDRVDIVHIGPCSGASTNVTAVRQAATTLKDTGRVIRDREHGCHTIFEMPDGFGAYLQGLSKNQRHSYKRNLNKLGKTFEFEVDVVRDPAMVEDEFDAFADMHQSQWQAVGKLGHFGDWPGSREFSRDLVRTLTVKDRVRILRLIVDGRVVAYHWCLSMNDTYHSRLVGRLTGEQWDEFALGRVNQLKLMEAASADGATIIEAGTGRYDYKDRLNATTLPLRSITFVRRTASAAVRARLTLAYGDLLDLLYYRVWYLRIAPQARFLRRPLWRGWIRRRF